MEHLLLGEQVVTFEFGNHYKYKQLTKTEARFGSEHDWCAFLRIKDDKENISSYVDHVVFD